MDFHSSWGWSTPRSRQEETGPCCHAKECRERGPWTSDSCRTCLGGGGVRGGGGTSGPSSVGTVVIMPIVQAPRWWVPQLPSGVNSQVQYVLGQRAHCMRNVRWRCRRKPLADGSVWWMVDFELANGRIRANQSQQEPFMGRVLCNRHQAMIRTTGHSITRSPSEIGLQFRNRSVIRGSAVQRGPSDLMDRRMGVVAVAMFIWNPGWSEVC